MTQTGDGTTKMVAGLRKVRFDDPAWFEGLPFGVSYLLLEHNPHYRLRVVEARRDIAAGLVHSYTKNPEFFDDFAAAGVQGMDALVSAAVSASRKPLAFLMGADEALLEYVSVKSEVQLAGFARLAIAGIDPIVLQGFEKFDAAEAPAVDGMEGFAEARLNEKFGPYRPWFELLECSAEEKYRILWNFCFGENRHHSVTDLSWMFAMVERRNLPLHRVLDAYTKVRKAEMALEMWDMPDDYLYALAKGA